jgi:hypothetical protein
VNDILSALAGALGDDENEAAAAIARWGISAVLDHMQQSTHCRDIQGFGCTILGWIAQVIDDYARDICDKGGLSCYYC